MLRPAPAAGFSILETMIAIAIAGIVGAVALSAFQSATHDRARSSHDWIAFTLAQQQMEQLTSAPKTSSLLEQNDTTAGPGTDADLTCAGVPAAFVRRTDELGNVSAAGLYETCWKITNNSPGPNLRNIRVITSYPNPSGGLAHAMLQTLR